MNKFLGLDITSGTHNKIYVCGFKINLLKSGIRNFDIDYSQYNSPADIPPAIGTLREIQLANLALLKIFNKICKRENLTYWLDFGTLLGAVRHGGFIPWDDDLDIGMPRQDYERMINIIEQENQLYIEFETNGRNKCCAKVQHILCKDIFIDIFPYDFYYRKTTDEDKVVLHKRIMREITKLKFSLFPVNDTTILREKLAEITKKKILQSHPSTPDTIFWGIDFPHDRWKKRVYDTENILPLKRIKFEGIEFPCPYNSDFVLKNIYGNYMTLPQNTYPKHTYISKTDSDKLRRLKRLIKAGELCEE